MTAYYNDFDKDVCAWLRELIKAGLIAPGEVDERSILDVTADDVRGFTQVHFFAGIGGWSCALRLAGWPDDRPVWTGSPPCQPFSVAGQQKGRDDARHLAPHFVDLVRSCRPGVLFGEQVASAEVFGKAASGARKRVAEAPQWAWLDDLSDRLEAARYAVGASDFPSAGVGAPHIRQRTFFGAVRLENTELPADQRQRRYGGEGLRQQAAMRLARGSMADGLEPARAGSGLLHAGQDGRLADSARCGWREERENGRGGAFGDCQEGIAAGSGAGRGDSGLADADGRDASAEGLQRSGEQRQQPQDGGIGHNGGPGPLHGFWADADWLFCRDGKWRPVEPGTFPLALGIPGRVGLLRGYGNAINPHAAARFIQSFTEAAAGLRHFRMTDVYEVPTDNEGIFG